VCGGGRISGLVKLKAALKEERTQINGECNISGEDENTSKQNMNVEPLFENYKKTARLFIDRRL
jgi:hypothetical protein